MEMFSANSSNPLKMVMGTLMGHLVYGLVLGLTAKQNNLKMI